MWYHNNNGYVYAEYQKDVNNDNKKVEIKVSNNMNNKLLEEKTLYIFLNYYHSLPVSLIMT